MKIFNLTDVHTDELKKVNMCDQHITFCRHIIPPGGHIDIEVPARQQQALQQYVTMGVLAVHALPPSYVVKKMHQKPIDPKILEQISKKKRALGLKEGK